MGAEQNIKLSVRAFEVWMQGDVEGTLALFDEGIEIYVPDDLLNAGTFRGHEQFLGWIREWDDAWEDYELEVVDASSLGERHVLSHIRQRAKGRGSGVPVEMDIAWLTEIRGEKITALHLYPTLEQARSVGEEREASRADAAGG